MQRLTVFDQVSLDGYFADSRNDMSWAHRDDPEWNAFVSGNASGGTDGTLLFGRVTYQMMASFWPTPLAAERMAVVAKRMNEGRKAVFSNTLKEASWQNTRLLRGDLATEIGRLKSEPGGGIVVLGSGKLVAGLSEARLVDEYQIIVNPLVLGSGRTLFEGVRDRIPLRLTSTRAFGNGNVLLTYAV